MGDVAGRDELSQIIGDVYEAALTPSLWAGTPPKLARAFRSTSAVLKTYRVGGDVDLLETTDNMQVAPKDQAWAEHWHQNDLWVERSRAVGPGQVVVGHELIPLAEFEETGYYRDWLRRLSIYHVVGGVMRLPSGGLGVLGVHRDRDGAAYGEAERRATALLLPHLARALRIRERLSLPGLAAFASLERSGLALLICEGRRRQVVFSTPAAERLLGANDELSTRGGRLAARDGFVETSLASAFAATLAVAAGQVRPAARALPIPRAGRTPLILVFSPLPERAGVSGEPAVLVLVRDPEAAGPAASLLREVFGLTAAEAGVAAALARGLTLPDVAAEFGVGLATIRSHLKSILAKTHTNRQAELVALLMGALGHLQPLLPHLGDEAAP